ncbi:MAG: hypothetical protein PHO19_00455 [Candidatus Pacebacteria bacterium]|nr:hypothetical protein [Candidatus Paceibacterota bacterium]
MKKIISVGFDIPGYADDYKPYTSSQSLLDADIVVFEPDFSNYSYYDSYQGKPSFSENESFRLKEDTRHWHSEISTALQDGKTVLVFMGQYEEVFVHTGQKQYSGTGRNTRVTNLVSSYNNYEFLPVDIPGLIPKEGTELKFNNNGIFTTFWSEFKERIKYESYIDGKIETPLFFTKTGNKPVGGLFRVGKGNLVLLPPVRYPEKFTKYEKEESFWTDEAVKFGKRLIQVLVDIDNALRGSVETSPPPDWVAQKEYRLKLETELKKKIDNISKKIETFTTEKNTLLDSLHKEMELKNLIYEKGKPLENAIIKALEILGYKAENYDDGSLEIDQIIVSPEGERYIGEAEGKDNGAINIDKFRQLESNIQEDLQKEEVSDPAIGILFGNGFRVIRPEKREEQFTDKCIKNAERLNAILVRTSDLFEVVRYVRENSDKKFAKECRKAILESRGKIVKFPEIDYSKNKKKS